MGLNLQPFAPYLGAITIIVAIVITVLVVLQSKGNDLSGFLGGESGGFRTKRGLEAVMHRWTIYFGISFFIIVFFAFIAWGQTP